jgi:hypothetical protein
MASINDHRGDEERDAQDQKQQSEDLAESCHESTAGWESKKRKLGEFRRLRQGFRKGYKLARANRIRV